MSTRKKNLIVMFCCAAGVLSAQNLIDNPSFEEGSPVNAALPAQWSTMKLLSMENHHSLDSSTAKTGKSSAKLTSKNIDGIKHLETHYQPYCLQPFPSPSPMSLKKWNRSRQPRKHMQTRSLCNY